jgi:hypothetical protein
MNTWNIEKLANLNKTHVMQFSALVALRSTIERGRANAPSDTNRQAFLQSFAAVSQRFAAHVADLNAFSAVLQAAASTNAASDQVALTDFHRRFDALTLQGHHLITENNAQMEQDTKLFPNGF